MNDALDFEFACRGHEVQVRRVHVPDEWLGADDTLVTVNIDGGRVEIPNLLDAYRTAGKMGVQLVVTAYLDGEPSLFCKSVNAARN